MRIKQHRTLGVGLAMLMLMLCLSVVADLRDYAPTNVSVTIASGTLLAADSQVRVVQLTNTGSYPVWYCHSGQTAVVGKGFYLDVGSTATLTGQQCPNQGLNAIADGGTTTVAIGKG